MLKEQFIRAGAVAGALVLPFIVQTAASAQTYPFQYQHQGWQQYADDRHRDPRFDRDRRDRDDRARHDRDDHRHDRDDHHGDRNHH